MPDETEQAKRDPAEPSTGRGVYLAFIESDLEAARARAATLDARCGFIVTSAGALVSLLLGFLALAGGREPSIDLLNGSRSMVNASMVGFATAAALAIIASLPHPRRFARPSFLRQLTQELWEDTERDAQLRVVGVSIAYIEEAHRNNAFREPLVVSALTAEALAVASLALAVSRVLENA